LLLPHFPEAHFEEALLLAHFVAPLLLAHFPPLHVVFFIVLLSDDTHPDTKKNDVSNNDPKMIFFIIHSYNFL